MTDGPPDPRRILEETDWARLQHAGGAAFPVTPNRLSSLSSGKPGEVTSALDHLWDDLFHQGSLYSATPAAALYVASILGDPASRNYLAPAWEQGKRPLRSNLLEWLAELAYSVSHSSEMQIKTAFKYSPMERIPLFGEVRGIRPAIFEGVSFCIADSNPDVKEAALLAAVHLLDDPALASQRDLLAPEVRGVLAASSRSGYRSAAAAALASWGQGTEAPSDAEDPAKSKENAWNDFYRDRDRGPIDESPF